MNKSKFESRYPGLSDILPDDMMSKCEDGHILKVCIERDREDALEMWSYLVEKSPAQEIKDTYENSLHKEGKFRAFVTELWCYQALSRWLCENPQVLDCSNIRGMPDFACEGFDVDATLLQEADEEDRIRRKLEDIMGDSNYIGRLSLKPEFDAQATTSDRWGKNETAVNDFIDLIERDLDPNNPKTIETEAIKIEFEEVEQGPFGLVVISSARRIDPDDENKIPERLRTKANQPREDKPMVVFMDCRYSSIDYADEVRDILIGEPYGFATREEVEISPRIQSVSNDWNHYLVDIGAVPDSNDEHHPFSAIPPGNEGVFSDQILEQIAGVMFRMKSGNVCYIPNVYTNSIDAKSIFDKLNWRLETHKLTWCEL